MEIIARLAGTLQSLFGTEGGIECRETATPSSAPVGYRRLSVTPEGIYYLNETRIGGSIGVVPIGAIVAHYAGGIANAATLAECRDAGFAACDGTTPASQGISEAVITDAMPDLNGEARFLRGGTAAGTAQDHALQSHTHALPNNAPESCMNFFLVASNPAAVTTVQTGVAVGNTAGETRPTNRSVLWLMRVR
jgi:hypothetical protein